jgi:glycosyltransferase involved in cell wall biosynthesis
MTVPEPRRVLIATITLAAGTGTAVYTRDLALALLRRGHLPIVYASQTGPIADELRRATIPVVTDLDGMAAPPDVIHGHHQFETLVALTRFPGVPALFVCHDGLTWHSIPPVGPRIGLYVAVDRNCRDRMLFEHGISEQSIHLLANPVDLQRFARRPLLPPKPERALVFSNHAEEETSVKPIREACERRGIALDIGGAAAGRPIDRPEEVLPQYDLVFAKARCALEALAAGCAVIVCDTQGLAGMVTTGSLEAMRQLNFGARTLSRAITAADIGGEIDRYDPADAAAVCERIRQAADSDLLADQFISLYDELCARPPAPPPDADELLAVSRSLSRMAAQLYAHVGTGQAAAAPPPVDTPRPVPRSGLLRRLARRFRRLTRL